MSANRRRRQTGATVTEYAILASLVAMAVVLILALVGEELNDTLADSLRCIQEPTTANCTLD